MAELATVEIHSPKDPSKRWVINQSDLDPAKHRLWNEQPVPSTVASTGDLRFHPNAFVLTVEDQAVPVEVAPKGPDYTYEDGVLIRIDIVDPEDRRRRLQVVPEAFDPSVHQLWSSRNE